MKNRPQRSGATDIADAIIDAVQDQGPASLYHIGTPGEGGTQQILWSNFSAQLGFQVTDLQDPSRNSIEIGRVAFSLNGLNLLRRKVIIQEMAADGMRFGTPRVATDKIERARTNRCVQQPAVINVVVATPELDESVLDNVFRICC